MKLRVRASPTFSSASFIRLSTLFSTWAALSPSRYRSFLVLFSTATPSTICPTEKPDPQQPTNSEQVLRTWGCTDSHIHKIFLRVPSLKKASVSTLQSKLSFLGELGVDSSDLVKMINCRPRLLGSRLDASFDQRFLYFMDLFGSKQVLVKAIVRNPSLLTYDLRDRIKPVVELYHSLGVTKQDLIPMLLSRPTLIPRTSFDDEKLEYIRKAGISKTSKMYKYLVTIIGISRLETVKEKVANFDKFGFSEDQIWRLFGRNPLVLTLSIDKVQRNMTFVMAVMKLPPQVVLTCPYLLFKNLESVMRPRVLLDEKIVFLGLMPRVKGDLMLKAMRMSEKRFLKVFVGHHPEHVVDELMEYYTNAKGFKRLAEASKKNSCKGFPF